MQRKASFGEQFISDLSTVIVLLVPVQPVESAPTRSAPTEIPLLISRAN
jgi:hypothetical protein